MANFWKNVPYRPADIHLFRSNCTNTRVNGIQGDLYTAVSSISNRISRAHCDIIAPPRTAGGEGRRVSANLCHFQSVLYGRIRPRSAKYCWIQTTHESRGFKWATVGGDFDRHRVSFDHQSCGPLIGGRFQNWPGGMRAMTKNAFISAKFNNKNGQFRETDTRAIMGICLIWTELEALRAKLD